MPNWNCSSVEILASSGASSTWWGNSPGQEFLARGGAGFRIALDHQHHPHACLHSWPRSDQAAEACRSVLRVSKVRFSFRARRSR